MVYYLGMTIFSIQGLIKLKNVRKDFYTKNKMYFLSKSANDLILNTGYWDRPFGQNFIKYCDGLCENFKFSIYGKYLELYKINKYRIEKNQPYFV